MNQDPFDIFSTPTKAEIANAILFAIGLLAAVFLLGGLGY